MLILLLLVQSDLYEPKFSFEPGVAISYEMWGGGGTVDRDSFHDGGAPSAQLGFSYAWPTPWGFELKLSPYVGGSYRKFDGEWITLNGAQVKPEELTIVTAHGGMSFAAGCMNRGEDWGFLGFVNAQAGWAFHERVRASAPGVFAGYTELVEESTQPYYGAGVGFEARRSWVAVHIEIGVRHFGRSQQGGGVLVIDESDLLLYYLQIGAIFSF